MSRVGFKPLPIPDGIEVSITEGEVRVKGKGGELSEKRVPGIDIEKDGKVLRFKRKDEMRATRECHGLMRSLVANMIHGVHKGFDCTLNIVGVGYKADVRGKSINFNLGHSHAISFPLPEGITASFDKPSNSLTIKGNKKQLVGEVAAEIRQLRPPEPYKGKGVMYKGEKILRKVGKTGTK